MLVVGVSIVEKGGGAEKGRKRTFGINSSRMYLSASAHASPYATTSCAPAVWIFVTINGLIVDGTTTVHGMPSVRDACTAARPALPPDEQKMCGAVICEGSSSRRRRR